MYNALVLGSQLVSLLFDDLMAIPIHFHFNIFDFLHIQITHMINLT